MTYRKKPVVIEAVPVAEAIQAAGGKWDALPKWLADAYEKGRILFLPRSMVILTLEGNMSAGLEDYIIRGVKGELYPCRGDIFNETYEPVSQGAAA